MNGGGLAVQEDRTLSPYTGWTRVHWEELADRMLAAVRPYATERHALIRLPGPASKSGRHSDGLEGYARTFLPAAFRLAGAGGDCPGDLAERYASGLAAGTDPDSPERWPRMSECNQAKVESASIAIALHETRPWIWDRLDGRVQANVVGWLSDTVGSWAPKNNWVWFQAIVEAFLRSVGGPWEPRDIEHTHESMEKWYAGGGWYADGADMPGPFRNFDHYSGWAMHFYPLWYCRISGDDAEPGVAQRYRDSLREYLTDLQHLVGGDGAPLYQGRSLTYRFAAAAPFWADQLFGADALRPGLTRRIGSGMLRHFSERGCLDAERGLLSRGWHSAHPPIRQSYSGPASPYWAGKCFAGLLFPADHPAWTAVEEPLPVERADFVRALTAPGWVASGTKADGVIRVVNHGADHAGPSEREGHAYDPFYSRWAYSTATGPELGGEGPPVADDGTIRPSTPDLDLPGGGPLDSHVALLDAQGRPSHRRPLHRLMIEANSATSHHRVRWPQHSDSDGEGPEFHVVTGSVLRGAWEVRAVRIDGPRHADPGRLRIGGWAVAAEEPPEQLIEIGRALAACTPTGLRSAITAVCGSLHAGIRMSVGRSSFGTHAAVPYLETVESARLGEVYVAAIALGRTSDTGNEPPSAQVSRGTGPVEIDVSWPDGHTDTLRLPPQDDLVAFLAARRKSG